MPTGRTSKPSGQGLLVLLRKFTTQSNYLSPAEIDIGLVLKELLLEQQKQVLHYLQ